MTFVQFAILLALDSHQVYNLNVGTLFIMNVSLNKWSKAGTVPELSSTTLTVLFVSKKFPVQTQNNLSLF